MAGIIQDTETKKELIATLRDTSALAEQVGMATLAKDLVTIRLPKLEEERFHLVVLGEFNHGKSTFVNALLGQPVLPAGITPTTATINHVVWAESPCATAYLTDGKSVNVDTQKIGDWVTIEGKEAGHVKYVEIGWPAEILKDRLTLVDTPGVNDINEQRAEITYGYIPKADACLFLLDGAQVLKQSERAFLEQRILRRSRDKLIFIIGKIDLLAPDEREQAIGFCREHLGRIVQDPMIFPLSAKRWLQGDPVQKAGSGMQALIDHLGRYLAEERGRVLLDNGVSDGLRTAGYLRQNLGIKRVSLQLSLDELEARIAKVKSELEHRKATLRAMHEKIRAESQAIAATVRIDLEEFAAAFTQAIPEEVDRANADDIKRYFQLFLQDKWKEWAEREGEKVSNLLEKLAEEIIQVTNENLASAMATLAAELGPAETRIDIEVDTLKYDVGALGLGAVGTVMLFINPLIGGVLTIAAPLLFIVLKERASGQIKQQVKETAPEVIKKAAQAVGPRLEQIVSDFAGRLSDFVTAAGDALHRGISEVLDRALAERRAQGVDVSQRDAEIAAQLERLGEIERRLGGLRDKLWGGAGPR
jgi:small GTP-binding protein